MPSAFDYPDPGTNPEYCDAISDQPDGFGTTDTRDPVEDAVQDVLKGLQAFQRQLDGCTDFEQAMTLWETARDLSKAALFVSEACGAKVDLIVEQRR